MFNLVKYIDLLGGKRSWRVLCFK